MPNSSVLYRVRQFEVGTIIDLYELDLSRKGGDVYYFTNNVMEERVPIQFDGHVFLPIPINMEDITVDPLSSPASPKLSISTIGGPVAALIEQYNDLRGALVRRYETFAEFLDIRPDGEGGVEPNPDADGSAIMSMELFVIDRKDGADDEMAEFTLVSPTDMDGIELPRQIIRKRWCSNMYRIYQPSTGTFVEFEHVDGGCPYRGTAYFDQHDQPTTIDKDKCSKRLSGCLRRYGYQNGEGRWVSNVALPAAMAPGVRASAEAG